MSSSSFPIFPYKNPSHSSFPLPSRNSKKSFLPNSFSKPSSFLPIPSSYTTHIPLNQPFLNNTSKSKHSQSFSLHKEQIPYHKPINRCSSAKFHKKSLKSMHISKSIPDKDVNDLFYVHKVYVQFKYNLVNNKQKIRYRMLSARPYDTRNSQCTQTQCTNKKGKNVNRKKEGKCLGWNRKLSVFVLKFLNRKKVLEQNKEREIKKEVYGNRSKSERNIWI